MKGLLLSSILIILYVSQVRASSSEKPDDKCIEEYDKQRVVLSNCTKRHLDEFAFTDEANLTIKHYAGDDAAVRAFAIKYCPKLHNAISCIPLRYDYDISDNCRSMFGPFKYNETVLFSQVLLNILNYVCENNAEVLVQIVQNDGLATIMDNEKFEKCAGEVDIFKMVNENAEVFEINPAYCSAQEKVLECYLETVKLHRNENLAVIANAIWEKARTVLTC